MPEELTKPKISPWIWDKIYKVFKEHGFSDEECTAAADQNLNPTPRHPERFQVQVRMINKILRNRLLAIRTLVKYAGDTWDEAVKARDEWRRDICRIKKVDEMDIIQGET